MKIVRNVKYLSSSEACWYVGVDEHFLNIFAEQGKLNTICDSGGRFYEFEGLNRIKDTLADDAGQQKIASDHRVTLKIARNLGDPLSLPLPLAACIVSTFACLACVALLVMSNNVGTENQPKQMNVPMAGVPDYLNGLPIGDVVSKDKPNWNHDLEETSKSASFKFDESQSGALMTKTQ